MTSKNITDVYASPNFPVNPYKTGKSEEGAKENFMSLLSGAKGGNVNVKTDVSTESVGSAPRDAADVNDAKNVASKVSGNETRVSKAEEKPAEPVDMEEVKDAVEEFEKEVKDLLKEELGITEEELESAMETLGLTFIDLTQPSNLAMLLNELKGGEDSVSLLLDSSVKNIFDAMGELTGNLIEETGLDTKTLIDISSMTAVTEEEMAVFNPEVSVETKEDAPAEAPVIKALAENAPLKTEEVPAEETKDSEPVEVLSKIVTETANKEGANKQSAGNQTFEGNAQPQSAAPLNMDAAATAAEPVRPFAEAVSSPEPAIEVPVYTDVNPSDIIEQVVTAARVSITEQVRSMELELNPQHLGRMLMQVSETEGQVTARFITQNDSVKAALEGAIANLIDKLNEAGVKVEAVEVTVGTHEFEQNLENAFAGDAREDLNESQNNNQQRRTGGINLGDPGFDAEELSEEDELTANIMRTYGNTVNFRA